MNVLSLFNGMGCIWIALDRLGIKVNKRYSSEIDKYATQVNDTNYPDTIQLGDVTKVKARDLDKIDLLVGGSPCQGFSFAGKQLAFDDQRSKLFFEFVRLLDECKPKYFMLENVRMKQEYQDIISRYLGVKPVRINSNLVSAQNRDRYYWTNIEGITQPEDKGILLEDILEGGYTNRSKSQCTPSTIYKEDVKSMLQRGKHGLKISKVPAIKSHGKLIYKPHKSQCLDANYFKGADNHGQRTGLVEESEIRKKSKCVRSSGLQSYDRHEWDSVDVKHWRKLTPIECERLQTVPDNYTSCVSNTQRYKMLGNGWTVDIIAHILRNIQNPIKNEEKNFIETICNFCVQN